MRVIRSQAGAERTRRPISHFSGRSIERHISKRHGENLWNSQVSPLISLSPRRWMDAEIARPKPECHGRTNPTDRTNAGIERGRGDVARASRYASAEGAGTTPATETPGRADRKTKARAGRTEPAPGGTRTRARRNDRQAFAFARDPGT